MTKVPESKLTLELFQYTLLGDGYKTPHLVFFETRCYNNTA